MKALFTTPQVMSLYSGFTYCTGPELGRIYSFMTGQRDGGIIGLLSFAESLKQALAEQHPWLVAEVSGNPVDYENVIREVEMMHGKTQIVTSLGEHLNGAKADHDYPDGTQIVIETYV